MQLDLNHQYHNQNSSFLIKKILYYKPPGKMKNGELYLKITTVVKSI